MRKSSWISVGLAGAGSLVSVAVWSQVPDPMPIHWNAAGEADGFAPRVLGLLMMPVLIAVLAPFISWMTDTHVGADKGKKAVDVIVLTMSSFLLGMHVLMVQAAMSPDAVLSMAGVMSLMGVMFAVLGAVMPMLPQNKVAGFRTPWTLKSDTNWKLTHRFGAWTMGIGGVICVITSLLLSGQAMFWIGFAAIMIGSLLPVMYSYMLHRAEKTRL
jgi:uncharacterized membrane protein